MSAPELPATARRPNAKLLTLLVVGTTAVALGIWGLSGQGFAATVRSSLANSGNALKSALREEIFLNPWFYVVVAGVFLLEYLIPAKEGQGALTSGLRQDLLWVGFKMLIQASLFPAYVGVLRIGYERYLSFLTIHSVAAWPWFARFALALLWGDFLFWLIHYIRHRVSLLWQFHAVHHSQEELNFFTEYRVHPFDDLFAMTLGFIPLLMVEHSFVSIVAIVWIRHWHTRFCHSNIRTNLGPLRYVLVTPQSHRVHHSIEPAHHDCNFGLTFSIWDHLFRTQCRDYTVYPDTGINDLDFPAEQREHTGGVVGGLTAQLLYPFRAIFRRQGNA